MHHALKTRFPSAAAANGDEDFQNDTGKILRSLLSKMSKSELERARNWRLAERRGVSNFTTTNTNTNTNTRGVLSRERLSLARDKRQDRDGQTGV